MKRIFSGVQPSGQLTLGNYLGAIRNWVSLQKEAEDSIFCVVDMHAITVPQDPAELRSSSRQVAAAYIACGIDTYKSSIFIQSHVPEHTELGWMLGCITPMGWLNRMTQFKDKAGKNKEKASLALYGYPVLQAADILLYHTTHVPVGEDQKQHIELARDIAGHFNARFGVDYFTLPEPLIQGLSARVMSLRDGTKKMSKSDDSDYSRINLSDDADLIRLKIQKAKTDPLPLPSCAKEMEERPEAQNLLMMYASLTNASIETVCREFEGCPFSVFKPRLADLMVETLSPISREIQHLMKDKTHLDSILEKGAHRARTLALKTILDVKKIFGLT